MGAKNLGQSVNELLLKGLVLCAGNPSPCQSKHSEYGEKLAFPHGRILRGSPRAIIQMGKVGEILLDALANSRKCRSAWLVGQKSNALTSDCAIVYSLPLS